MSQALEKYLDRVMIYANRNQADAPNIRAELKDHLLKKIEDLEAQGAKREDTIFQAIEDHGNARQVGYGLRPRFSWVDVRTKGTARGFIAVGPKAVGVIAIGGIACGVLSYGGLSFGVLSFGGLALAAMMAFGGLAIAPLGVAYGGLAIGLITVGGVSVGVAAVGGLAVGLLTVNDYCGETISCFAQANCPGFIKSVSRMLNSHFIGILMVGFWISCIVMLTVQLFLSRKERRRIKNADPSLVE